jgi:hypothetical protein
MHSGARKRLTRRRNMTQKQIVAESRRREEEAVLKRSYQKFPSENTLPHKEAPLEQSMVSREESLVRAFFGDKFLQLVLAMEDADPEGMFYVAR